MIDFLKAFVRSHKGTRTPTHAMLAGQKAITIRRIDGENDYYFCHFANGNAAVLVLTPSEEAARALRPMLRKLLMSVSTGSLHGMRLSNDTFLVALMLGCNTAGRNVRDEVIEGHALRLIWEAIDTCPSGVEDYISTVKYPANPFVKYQDAVQQLGV